MGKKKSDIEKFAQVLIDCKIPMKRVNFEREGFTREEEELIKSIYFGGKIPPEFAVNKKEDDNEPKETSIARVTAEVPAQCSSEKYLNYRPISEEYNTEEEKEETETIIVPLVELEPRDIRPRKKLFFFF